MSILKTSLQPGYRLKLIQLVVQSDPRSPSVARFIAQILQRLIDGKVLTGEISSVSQEDIEKDLKMGTRELIRDFKKRSST